MPQILKNNVSGVLNGGITAAATSMTLVDASNFPGPGTDYYLLTLVGLNSNGQEASWEIVKVTSKASNTLTMVRAQEGTTAQAWPSATSVQMRLTAGSVATADGLATKENAGTAAASVAAHEAAADPHPQYATTAEAAAAAPVQSVAGKTGAVTLAKGDVGLGNVDNTSDADKPISTAAQTALNAKQPLDADLTAIAALSGTSGLLKKTAAGTWSLDTTTYSTLALGSTAGSALAASGSAGTATTAAKSDHVHPFPTAANVGAEPAITKSAGFAKWSGSAWTFDNSTYQTAQSVTGLVKSSGTTRSAAVAGTDYVAPGTATTFTATQTFKGIGETVYNLTGTDINPANGTIQYKTLTANTTFTESLADGQSVILMLNPSTFAATWPTTTWIGTAASTAPTLVASVYNCITFFQFAGTLYGKYEGRV